MTAAPETRVYNIDCDESCHLENDRQPIMLLGAVWCEADRTRALSEDIRALKAKHGLAAGFEVKWVKVSNGKAAFYSDLLDYFLSSADLRFRSLIVVDKSRLRHSDFAQKHDDWFYKMYYTLLKIIPAARRRVRIYIDYKDTHGGEKVGKLRQVLRNSFYDWNDEIIERVQVIRSDESELLQLTDFLMGIVGYANRGLSGSEAKVGLVRQFEAGIGRSLLAGTSPDALKVNLFRWTGQTLG